MEGGNGSCGGSRRRFLKAAAATGAALASAESVLGADPKDDVPYVTLGKTVGKVTKLGMGTSGALSPSFVQAALFSGVRYIDTAEGYEGGVAEKVVGEVLERTGMRKQVYLVTKNSGYRKATGSGAMKIFE